MDEPATAGLPRGCEATRSTPVFTEATIPPGLLRSHRTASGTWGLIRVMQGRLLYRILDPVSERVLDPIGAPGLVEPGVLHEVAPLGPVCFQVEFYRMVDGLQQAERHVGESQAEAVECSSPPCLMHELDPAFMEQPERPRPPVPSPEKEGREGSGEEWREARLWRKAKRAVLIERRLAMPATERAASSEAITATLIEVLSSFPGAMIGFYWPFKGEYDPRPLCRSLHGSGTRLALPVVVEKSKPLIVREWWPGMPMASGVWNIPVPAVGEPTVPDVLLVPLVGCDKQSYRLGYGGGYYDRTLAALPTRPRAIGVGFELSQISTIHPQSHDIPMDLVVTERGQSRTIDDLKHA